MPITREEAYKILREWTESESLIKHALGVEACMKYFAEKLGEDVEILPRISDNCFEIGYYVV